MEEPAGPKGPAQPPRRDARAAESDGLENRCGPRPPWVQIPLPPLRGAYESEALEAPSCGSELLGGQVGNSIAHIADSVSPAQPLAQCGRRHSGPTLPTRRPGHDEPILGPAARPPALRPDGPAPNDPDIRAIAHRARDRRLGAEAAAGGRTQVACSARPVRLTSDVVPVGLRRKGSR
jgi:hypothetical protein